MPTKKEQVVTTKRQWKGISLCVRTMHEGTGMPKSGSSTPHIYTNLIHVTGLGFYGPDPTREGHCSDNTEESIQCNWEYSGRSGEGLGRLMKWPMASVIRRP